MMIMLFFAAMGLYFWLRKKRPASKYGAEVLTILLVLVISFATKLCIILTSASFDELSGASWLNVIACSLSSLYATLGGFTFEGLGDIFQLNAVWFFGSSNMNIAAYLYYGTSLVAAATLLCAITAKTGYELFSHIRIRFYTFLRFLRLKKNRDVYIFTALNDEILMLAQSIKTKKPHSMIIFSGSDIPHFDRNNEFCREVMANNYYYWSYAKIKDNVQSNTISKRLHLSNHNFNKYNIHYAVFAFSSTDGSPNEEENSTLVYSDIKSRMSKGSNSEVSKTKRRDRKSRPTKIDDLRIEYYILTKREINYQAYEVTRRLLITQYAKNCCLLPCENGASLYKIKTFNNDKFIIKDDSNSNSYQFTFSELENYAMKSRSERKKAFEEDKLKKIKSVYDEIEKEFASRFVINVWNESNAIAKRATENAVEALQNQIIKEEKDVKLIVTTVDSAMAEKATTEKATVDSATAEKVTTENATVDSATAEKVTTENATVDSATAEKATTENATVDSATAEKATTEKATVDSAMAEKATTEKATVDSAMAEKATTEKATVDSATAKKVKKKKATVDSPMAEKATTEKATVDSATAEKVTTENATVDSATAEKVTAEKVTVDSATAEKATTEKATVDSATAEKVTAEKVITEKATVALDKSTASDIHICAVGFGATAQSIVKEIYVQTAFLDKNAKANKVTVEVFDPSCNDIVGLFQNTHPLFACVEQSDLTYYDLKEFEYCLKKLPDTVIMRILNELKKASIEEILTTLTPAFISCEKNVLSTKAIANKKSLFENMLKPNAIIVLKKARLKSTKAITNKKKFLKGKLGDGYNTQIHAGEMSFPLISFTNASCLSSSFFQFIDAVTGKIDSSQSVGIQKIIKKLKMIVINEIIKAPIIADSPNYPLTNTTTRSILDKMQFLLGNLPTYTPPTPPDVFIISTGDDFRNIQVANSLILDICNEHNSPVKAGENQVANPPIIGKNTSPVKPGKKQVMFLNIRDERNNSLLINADGIWDKNKLELKQLVVYIIGNRDKVYSYEDIIDHSEEINYQFGYDIIQQLYYTRAKKEVVEKYCETIRKYLRYPEKVESGSDFKEWVEAVFKILNIIEGFFKSGKKRFPKAKKGAQDEALKNISMQLLDENRVIYTMLYLDILSLSPKKKLEETEISWNKQDIWTRESNKSAKSFGSFLKAIYNSLDKNDEKEMTLAFSRLAHIEHQRWMRFHIAHGWTSETGTEKTELQKRHRCIVPYCIVSPETVLSDILNIILAVKM